MPIFLILLLFSGDGSNEKGNVFGCLVVVATVFLFFAVIFGLTALVSGVVSGVASLF